jgi:YD repeat-containing protein
MQAYQQNIFIFGDNANQLIEVTDAMGMKTISEYIKAGRRISVTHPTSGKTTFGLVGYWPLKMAVAGRSLSMADRVSLPKCLW